MYWPLKIVLPYLKNNDENVKKDDVYSEKGFYSSLGEGFEGDIKIAGQLMKFLLYSGEEPPSLSLKDFDDHFGDILKAMLKESKYERISLPKCISTLEDLLQIN
mgnify:CR=1 FL=1